MIAWLPRSRPHSRGLNSILRTQKPRTYRPFGGFKYHFPYCRTGSAARSNHGSFRPFSATRDGSSVSIVKLYAVDRVKMSPKFSAWNPALMVQGYYFVYENMLHMTGHIYDSALPRLMTCWKENGLPDGHYVGTVSLSNRLSVP